MRSEELMSMEQLRLMSMEQLRAKLTKGYEEAISGKTHDAGSALKQFFEEHRE